MMRRVGNRRRASWATFLHGELDALRAELGTSFASSLDELRRDMVAENDIIDTRTLERHTELVNALHRVADAFESIAEHLESDRRDRRQQLDAVEFLLREMVLGFAHPTDSRSAALGGSIDPGALGTQPLSAVDIDLTHSPMAVGTQVEVRSRFHDRWVVGFAVAEYVTGSDRRGYRLRRLAEPDQLPLLFDEGDVRRATLASDLPRPASADGPDHSIWR